MSARTPIAALDKTSLSNLFEDETPPRAEPIGAMPNVAVPFSEDQMYKFMQLPGPHVERLLRAIPPEAALASKSKKKIKKNTDTDNPKNDWKNAEWVPGSGSMSYPGHLVESDGDMHDAIFEIVFFFLYGWIPERYTVDVEAEYRKLELLMHGDRKEKEDKSEAGHRHAAMMWREHFKKELCVVLSYIIDEDTAYKTANAARSNQSELKIADMYPRLIASVGPYAQKPVRTMCTPVSLGGFRSHTLEIIDLVVFNMARYLNWYNDDLANKKNPEILTAAQRRVGRGEALVVVVPRNGVVDTLRASNQKYYSAPMHTALRRNRNETTILERFMEQTRYFWKPQTWTIRVNSGGDSVEEIVYPSMSRWKNSIDEYEILEILMGKRRLKKLLRGMPRGSGTQINYLNEVPKRGDLRDKESIKLWRNDISLIASETIPAVHLCGDMYTPWNFEGRPKIPSGNLQFKYGWYESMLATDSSGGQCSEEARKYPLVHRNGRSYYVDTYDTIDETMRQIYPELKKSSRY